MIVKRNKLIYKLKILEKEIQALCAQVPRNTEGGGVEMKENKSFLSRITEIGIGILIGCVYLINEPTGLSLLLLTALAWVYCGFQTIDKKGSGKIFFILGEVMLSGYGFVAGSLLFRLIN